MAYDQGDTLQILDGSSAHNFTTKCTSQTQWLMRLNRVMGRRKPAESLHSIRPDTFRINIHIAWILPCKGKKAQVHFTKFSGGRFFCFMQQRLTSLRKWLRKHTIWIASPSWIHLRTFHHGLSNKFRRISHKVFSLCILSLNPRSVQRKKSASAVAVNKKNASTRSFATNNASAWLALYFRGRNGIASGKDNRK